jgi:hypothetical protein
LPVAVRAIVRVGFFMFLDVGSPTGEQLRGERGNATGGSELHTIALSPRGRPRQDSMTIRLASSDGERNRANMLLSRMYSWRGYGVSHSLPSAPNCVTFTATADEDVIGTLTLAVDSASGLACDRLFKDELDKFRAAPGASLCELTKFAFDTSLPARPRLAALFHIIFIFGSLHYDCTDLFIEVNPRHRRFYQAMLGFTPVGSPKMNKVVNAPSQLMWLNVADIRQKIRQYAGDDRYAGRTLYADFFSAEEEQGIYRRLAAATALSADAGGISPELRPY